MAAPSDVDDRFVTHLERLRQQEDRGAIARLRRGLGKEPGGASEMHGLVLPWLPSGTPRWHEDACYLVASLFAAHPQPGGQGNLGGAFAALAAKKGRESVARRFVALLNCHQDDLPNHLRRAISLLRSGEIPVDWRQLLGDIQGWGHRDRYVQRRWAWEFWGAEEVSETAAA